MKEEYIQGIHPSKFKQSLWKADVRNVVHPSLVSASGKVEEADVGLGVES
ncbi:hypothetical protein GRI58_15155 [Porphyrobacter algicida]|uniref:Uncharacterized protein n=1 Tax=Qipengyuania algicida TaxID=1836209 RepID=A0A845ANR8_9SPHN|nr:hypothetical protein [Qipengyuania algicida]MXP30146.1 hypothetical protein [Qipengyuania algicida]